MRLFEPEPEPPLWADSSVGLDEGVEVTVTVAGAHDVFVSAGNTYSGQVCPSLDRMIDLNEFCPGSPLSPDASSMKMSRLLPG